MLCKLVEQAAQLSVSLSPHTQYLFNVPEGFARLVLEHRVRPGMGLRAVLATSTHVSAVVRSLKLNIDGFLQFLFSRSCQKPKPCPQRYTHASIASSSDKHLVYLTK